MRNDLAELRQERGSLAFFHCVSTGSFTAIKEGEMKMRWIPKVLVALLLVALVAQPVAAVVITTNWGQADAPQFATPAIFIDIFLAHENGTIYRCNTGPLGACSMNIPPGTIRHVQAYNENSLVISVPINIPPITAPSPNQPEVTMDPYLTPSFYGSDWESAMRMGYTWEQYLEKRNRDWARLEEIKKKNEELMLELQGDAYIHRTQNESQGGYTLAWYGAPDNVIYILGFYFPLPAAENASGDGGDGGDD